MVHPAAHEVKLLSACLPAYHAQVFGRFTTHRRADSTLIFTPPDRYWPSTLWRYASDSKALIFATARAREACYKMANPAPQSKRGSVTSLATSENPSAPDVNETVYSFRLLEALRSGNQTELHPFLTKGAARGAAVKELTSPLHLAVRCAEYPTIELCLEYKSATLNAKDSINGNTPLHLASSVGRADVVQLFLDQDDVDDTITNNEGKEPMSVAKTLEIAQIFQVSRAELNVKYLQTLEAFERDQVGSDELLALLDRPRVKAIDLNAQTRLSGTTLLHEAVRRKDPKLIETAVRKGADIFCRNRKGRRAVETTKDEKIRALLQQLSNADAARAVQQSAAGLPPIFRGYLAKWTNIAGGYKTRWFVLENGILSYYHTQEEEGKQSRGSTNLRFAKIRADTNDKHRFEVHSDASRGSASKLFLRGSHPIERARWVQVLQQTVDFFEMERAPSRSDSHSAQSVRGSIRTPSTTSLLDNTSTSHVPAGTKGVPGGTVSVPSRTGTPFRNISMAATPTIPEGGQPALVAPVPRAAPAGGILERSDSSTGGRAPSVRSLQVGRTPSLASLGSHTPSDEKEAELGNDVDNDDRPRGIPYEDSIALLSTNLRTQVELAHQLASSLNAPPAASITQSPDRTSFMSTRAAFSASPEGVRDALQDAIKNSASLLARYQEIVSEREAYLLRRYEQEIQAKRLWEENMRVLAQQHADMERQLSEAVEENARRRKALRGMRDVIASSPAGTISSPRGGVASPIGADTFASPQGSLALRRQGAEGALQLGESVPAPLSGPAATLDSLLSEDTAQDADDEFFDAIDNDNLPGLVVETPLVSAKDAREDATWPKEFDSKRIDEDAYEPYKRLRTKLPIGHDERPSVSLWAVLKNNIGKDLTKITFPVAFNEPTSMLQRMAEDLEFPGCLDAAASSSESSKRLAFVAAFAASNYSSTIGRIAKPFNPILGETFEYCSAGSSPYRYVSEQVSHHPPKSACLAEAPLWNYMGSVDAKSKFTGRSFEITPTGVAHVELKLPTEYCKNAVKPLPAAKGMVEKRVVEHYSWSKVTTVVSGFLTGSITIDHVGTLVVKNHATNEKCELNFRPRGWRGGNACEIRGAVYDAAGQVLWDIAGRWSTQLVARRRAAGQADLNPDEDIGHGGTGAEYVLLWRNNPKPPAAFNLTAFAATLNSLPSGLETWLPPTDCRLRPDLSAFESGRFSEADVLKGKLEDHQRATRRKREAGELPPHKPRWFKEIIEPDSGESMYEALRIQGASGEPEAEYWAERSRVGKERVSGDKDAAWKGADPIFGDLTASRARP
ncbi:Oxysterol-binding protein [Ceraceosorus bombacis]|uniref:Oxysterol-binding protein n=1 Tax=Ceraceosorus bombacis TaxID=401625 RepID=A0A0P1BIX5_9BASI|nr:Oxysterol-binding protein [Ceraceosorus bombacis]